MTKLCHWIWSDYQTPSGSHVFKPSLASAELKSQLSPSCCSQLALGTRGDP